VNACHFYRATLYIVVVLYSSVCYDRALCPHGSAYDRDFFTVWHMGPVLTATNHDGHNP